MSLRLISVVARFLTPSVFAQGVNLPHRTVVLTTGIRISLTQAFHNLFSFLTATAIGVLTLIFLMGAATLVISRGDQTKVDNGKKTMIGALVGLSIVFGAYAIFRTVIFFLYEGAA